MARELPPGYSEAAPSRELPPGYSLADEMKDAPASPRMAADAGEALITNLPAQGFKQNLVRGLPAAAGGMAGAASGAAMGAPFGPVGIIAGGIIGAGIGGGAGEATRQSVAQMTAGAFPEQAYPMATGREVLRDVGIQAATQAAGQALGVGIGAAAKAVRPAFVKGVSQLTRAATGMPEQTASTLIKDPGVMSRAMPISEAGKLYRQGVGDAAEGSLEAGRLIFGKTYPGPEAAVNTFDEMRPVLDAAKPQELLGMRQTLSDTLADTPRTSPKLRMMLSERLKVLDDLLESRLPDWGGARGAWRDAKVAEEAGSWLPLNKNLSPNALRTTAAVSIAASKAANGELMGLAALPFISPRVWSYGLRGIGYAGQVPASVYRVGAATGAGAIGSSLAQAYLNRKPATP